ncbi:MAG: phosphate ABC transporter ATP-binding protein [Bowdeniella nasicola]|nr:phosphate ABC transporter ATP-binding protein [Bowdeniella nasicola]
MDVRDLDIYYGDFKAVEGVTMAIEPRSITVLIGPSGCRKPIFLRTLNRMQEVIPGARVDGDVLIEGHDLYDPKADPVQVRRLVGMVFQRPNPCPTMSIAENVLAGVKLNRGRISAFEAAELVETSLRGANLWNEVKDRLGAPGSSLSGCQQQRLCIARDRGETAGHPMDEPCSALDPISTLAIEDLMVELKEQYTIVIVTHTMQQTARVPDRTGFFNLKKTGDPGCLVEIDETATMFSAPQHRDTEDYSSGRFG